MFEWVDVFVIGLEEGVVGGCVEFLLVVCVMF